MNQFIDLQFLAWIGLAITTSVLVFLYLLTGYLGVAVFRRLTRVYHMTVIAYWLGRLEAGGMREFQKAEKEDAELQQAHSKSTWHAPLASTK